jgi:hypothetical protein
MQHPIPPVPPPGVSPVQSAGRTAITRDKPREDAEQRRRRRRRGEPDDESQEQAGQVATPLPEEPPPAGYGPAGPEHDEDDDGLPHIDVRA